MPVDPWGGTNQGLANLGATFDDLNTRSRQRMLDARALAAHQDEIDRRAREEARLKRAEARQAELDALDKPYKQARNAEADLTLSEKRRAAARLKDYETEYAALGNGTVPTLEAVPNPDYVPPRAATPLSAIANRARANALAVASEGDPGAMAVDTSMLPTGQTAAVGSPVTMKPGTRPMNTAEQMSQRIALAIKHGQYDDLAKMGTAYDISDKLQTVEGRRFTEVMGKISSIRDQYGPDVAKELAPQIAQGYGIKPDTFEGIDFDAGGGVFKQAPDGEWYHLSNDGKSFHKLTPNAEGDAYKVGTIKEIRDGRNIVPMEYQGNKVWKPRPDLGVGVDRPESDRVTPRQMGIDRRNILGGLRKDPDIRAYKDVSMRYSTLEKAFAEARKTGNYIGTDQAIGYYVNKIFDQNSAVFPSEFARVAASQGVPDRVVAYVMKNTTTGGIGLTDQAREALMRTVKIVNNEWRSRAEAVVDQYRADAESSGLDPTDVDRSVASYGLGGGSREPAAPPKSEHKPVAPTPATAGKRSVVEERTLKNGQRWRSYSDGTFEQVK